MCSDSFPRVFSLVQQVKEHYDYLRVKHITFLLKRKRGPLTVVENIYSANKTKLRAEILARKREATLLGLRGEKTTIYDLRCTGEKRRIGRVRA